MRDVAKLSGVSISTVSRVLNDRVGVEATLAARVLDAVSVLDYRVDVVASALRRRDRRTATLGLVLADVGDPSSAALFGGFEEVARNRGMLAFAASSGGDPEREHELVATLRVRGADGLVVVPAGQDESHLRSALPLVFVDRAPRVVEADAVVGDFEAAARLATAHLHAHGHRRIAYLGGSRAGQAARERLWGFHRVMGGAGPVEAPVRVELLDSGAAAAALRELQLGHEAPTAVVTEQNAITAGVMHALRELSLHDRVGIVALDETGIAEALFPAVTVVALDRRDMGRRAAELLLDRIAGERAAVRCVMVEPRLAARGSGEHRP
jgi:LacI family transcriptional regulator